MTNEDEIPRYVFYLRYDTGRELEQFRCHNVYIDVRDEVVDIKVFTGTRARSQALYEAHINSLKPYNVSKETLCVPKKKRCLPALLQNFWKKWLNRT